MAKKITSFDDVVGHKSKIEYLRRCLNKDSVRDVMLFHGNPGIGKTTCAKILAVEIATMYHPELKAEYTNSIIVEDKSTDAIKLFNMSNLKDDAEIQNVKSELNIGFSRAGRKVLILDECHGMTKDAQDAILVELEHLPDNIFVIFCTTEVGVLREALVSRCSKSTLRFNDLTAVETRRLIKDEVTSRQLRFDMTTESVIAMIADWAGNQPRMAYNLLENFEPGSIVTARDLEVFIDTNTVPAVIELLKYLYGSVTLGMDYLSSIKYDSAFAEVLIEVCKVCLGHVSNSVNKRDTMYIKDFMLDRNPDHIMKFTAEVAGLPNITRRLVTSAFMRCHVAYAVAKAPEKEQGVAKLQDIVTISQNIDQSVVQTGVRDVPRVQSLASLLGDSKKVE